MRNFQTGTFAEAEEDFGSLRMMKIKNQLMQLSFMFLENVIKIIAPVLPFVSEVIYQNLIRNSDKNSLESVHLCDYPKAIEEYINKILIKNVDALKRLLNLGRSARSMSDFRIRQPLSKALYALRMIKFLNLLGKQRYRS